MADITVHSERQGRGEFRLIFVIALVFLVIEAAISSLLPRGWRRAPLRRIRLRSIVAEAREIADTSFPLSHLR